MDERGRIGGRDVQLRDATEADFEPAFEILRSALGPYIEQQYGWDEEAQRRMFGERFRPELIRFIVHEGSVVGLINVGRYPDHIHLRQLFLLAGAQGKGIGSGLLRELMGEADLRSVPIKLRVLKVNHRAMAFYARHGFAVCGETDTHHLLEYRASGTG